MFKIKKKAVGRRRFLVKKKLLFKHTKYIPRNLITHANKSLCYTNNKLSLVSKDLKVKMNLNYINMDLTHIITIFKKNSFFFIYQNLYKYIYTIMNLFNLTFDKRGTHVNFLTLIAVKFTKKKLQLMLPSKKIIWIDLLSVSVNDFKKYNRYLNYKTIFKYPKVRGIATNPNDHPNGGRSNTKQPFLNVFNKIAKNNKLCLN